MYDSEDKRKKQRSSKKIEKQHNSTENLGHLKMARFITKAFKTR